MNKKKEMNLNDLIDDNKEIEEQKIPTTSDAEWYDYVMKQFLPHEIDENGRPFVHGLRRMVATVIGTILTSKADIIDCPKDTNGWRAVARHESTIDFGNVENSLRTFSEVADASPENCKKYSFFPVAVAATRAEARNWRKILNIKCIAAEESEDTKLVISEETDLPKTINSAQLTAINKMAKIINVNAKRVLEEEASKAGEKFIDIAGVSFKTGQKAVATLNKLTNDVGNNIALPNNLKGYDPKWQESKK